MAKNKNKGLGKGFDALFPKKNLEIINNQSIIQEVPLNFIQNNPEQPRKQFALQELEELAQSIQNKGVLQPIILREKAKDQYEIIAGERRWRASKIAGLQKIKAIIYNIPTTELREIALIENIQRSDLNPIEEAAAYHSLLEKNSLTQESLAKKLGKSRASITNSLRLLSLPQKIIDNITSKKISVGHAKCLLSLENPSEQTYFGNLIIEKNLTVRDLEKELKSKTKQPKKKSQNKELLENNLIRQSRELLSDFLQTNVKIQQTGNKGAIAIQFYNQSDFQRILEKITKEK
jgi:ParB family chromosome partitioning protein